MPNSYIDIDNNGSLPQKTTQQEKSNTTSTAKSNNNRIPYSIRDHLA